MSWKLTWKFLGFGFTDNLICEAVVPSFVRIIPRFVEDLKLVAFIDGKEICNNQLIESWITRLEEEEWNFISKILNNFSTVDISFL